MARLTIEQQLKKTNQFDTAFTTFYLHKSNAHDRTKKKRNYKSRYDICINKCFTI